MKSVFIYDPNQREYVDDDGVKHIGPIYIKSWRRHEIVSETARSWVTMRGLKIPKNKKLWNSDIAETWDEVIQRSYVVSNSRRIGDAVSRIKDYETLKKIEELLNV